MGIEKYKIEKKIGQGSLGEVYKATNLVSGEDVAIKIISGFAKDENRIKRVLREIRALMSVKQENIVRLEEVGSAEAHEIGKLNLLPGRYIYLVMEYVQGESLAQKIQREGHISLSEACRIGMSIAKALKELKEKKIIHRDIKPSNILLGKTIKLTDFGISKMYTDPDVTQAGSLAGTPFYMAPEGYYSKWRPESDLYSLGAVLYHALTGKPVFSGVLVRVLKKQMEEEIILPPEIPHDLAQIIIKLLQRKPKERYQDLDKLIRDFRNAQESLRDVQSYGSFYQYLLAGKESLAKRVRENILAYPREGEKLQQLNSEDLITALKKQEAVIYQQKIWDVKALYQHLQEGKQKIEDYAIGKIMHDDFGDYYLGVRENDYDVKVFRRLPLTREDYQKEDWTAMINRIERGVNLVQWMESPYLSPVRDFTYYRYEKARHYHFLMDYLPHLSLREIITEQSLTEKEKIYILFATCKAVGAFFEQNFVLRLITPEILHITLDGEVKLSDFSFTKFGGWRGHQVPLAPQGFWHRLRSMFSGTLQGQTASPTMEKQDQFHSIEQKVGNSLDANSNLKSDRMRYFSPELLTEKPVDHRCDVWGIGLIGYELFTQRPLFGGNFRDVILGISTFKEPPATEDKIQNKRVVKILEKTLHPDPNKRYNSVYDIIQDLEHSI